ncbi:MAG: CHASE domain-containing protein [Nitrospinales bacterium]
MKQKLLVNGLTAVFGNRIAKRMGFSALVIAFFLAFGLLLLFLRQGYIDNQKFAVIQDAGTSIWGIRLYLQGDIDYLSLLAKERADEKLTPESFLMVGSKYVADHPALINITWIDSNFIVKNVAPLKGNRQIIGLTISLPEPARASQKARQTRQPVYTNIFKAIQGGDSFEVWLPIFKDNQFIGLFAGVYSLENFLKDIIPLQIRKRNYIEILDKNMNVLTELGAYQNLVPKVSKTIPISPLETVYL